MSTSELAYSKLWEKIADEVFSMAKCMCVTCNSCGCHPRCYASEWEDVQW